MSDKTSRKLRNATSGSFLPGHTIRNVSDNRLKYWASQGWIKRSGGFYVLTKKGYNAA